MRTYPILSLVFLFWTGGIANADSGSSRQVVFQCSFESDACNFQLIDTSADSPLCWHRRQGITLSNGESLGDHTTRSDQGTVLFANGGRPHSRTEVQTDSNVRCPTELCCFNAYVLMGQASDNGGALIAFYIVEESSIPHEPPTLNTLVNVSFTPPISNWIHLQHTFSSDSKPFLIGIEVSNGLGGRAFYAAVDDVIITSGMCESDVQMLDRHVSSDCGPPPVIIGGSVRIKPGSNRSAPRIATYNCVSGFNLVGPPTSTCLHNGQWSAPPVCSPVRPALLVNDPSVYRGHPEIFLDVPGDSGSYPLLEQPDSDCFWGEYFDDSNLTASDLGVPDAKLYLFFNNPINCSGSIMRWTFVVAPVPEDTPVYLSIWRPVKIGEGQLEQLKLVGINQFTAKQLERLVQFMVPGDQRITVQKGDIIGIIHKETSEKGSIYVFDRKTGSEQARRLYQAVPANIHIEDISEGETISVDPKYTVAMLPLLQAFVGNGKCEEEYLNDVTFSGVFTVVPGVITKESCWAYCRSQPGCYAITYHLSDNDCHYYSYISDEVRFTTGLVSMVRSCYSDCAIKLLSDGGKSHDTTKNHDTGSGYVITDGDRSFDLMIEGPTIQLQSTPKSAADCEIVCRYTPACTSFSYSNPFEVGSCIIYSNLTNLRREADKRSFRKWGCDDIHLLDNCQKCIGSYQCKTGSRCLYTSSSGETKCVPLRDASTCNLNTPSNNNKPVACPRPTNIQKGYVAKFVQTVPTPTATYACHRGYELFGNAEVRCVNMTWQPPIPNCRPACPGLPRIENGRAQELSSGSLVKQATVTCNRGFQLAGNELIVCVNSSTWSSIPTCIMSCGLPPVVANSNWMVLKGTQTLPQAVRYSCKDGFVLKGKDTLRCSNGLWSSLAPSCQAVDRCPAAPPLTNGIVVDSGTVNSTESVSYATYICVAGYELIGQATIFCQGNSRWGDLPLCAAFCGPVPPIENARVKILFEKHDQPSIIQYECLEGWKMEGDSIVTCISSLWSRLPNCVSDANIENCGQPPEIDNGYWQPILQLGVHPLSVEYFCNSGYYLMGPHRLVCTRTNNAALWQPAMVPCCRPLVTNSHHHHHSHSHPFVFRPKLSSSFEMDDKSAEVVWTPPNQASSWWQPNNRPPSPPAPAPPHSPYFASAPAQPVNNNNSPYAFNTARQSNTAPMGSANNQPERYYPPPPNPYVNQNFPSFSFHNPYTPHFFTPSSNTWGSSRDISGDHHVGLFHHFFPRFPFNFYDLKLPKMPMFFNNIK